MSTGSFVHQADYLQKANKILIIQNISFFSSDSAFPKTAIFGLRRSARVSDRYIFDARNCEKHTPLNTFRLEKKRN